jgi:hypothetical protein
MSDIFREVDEDLRRDQLDKLWKKYGSWVIGAAVLVVGATAAWTGWKEWQLHERRAESIKYVAALDLVGSGQADKAALAFAELGKGESAGHGLLARFEAAALKAKSGDKAAAAAAFTSIAEDGAVDRIYRDLAAVLSGLNGLGSAEPSAVIARVQPVAGGDGPWRANALEVAALAQLKSGDKAAARESYRRIADDLAAPPALRARAAEMVQALGT